MTHTTDQLSNILSQLQGGGGGGGGTGVYGGGGGRGGGKVEGNISLNSQKVLCLKFFYFYSLSLSIYSSIYLSPSLSLSLSLTSLVPSCVNFPVFFRSYIIPCLNYSLLPPPLPLLPLPFQNQTQLLFLPNSLLLLLPI